MEYIEREAAIMAIYDAFPECRNLGMTASVLSDIPAADVVEVVRCKDCQYSYEDLSGWACSHGVCVDCIVPEDFYCGMGKRRVEWTRSSTTSPMP